MLVFRSTWIASCLLLALAATSFGQVKLERKMPEGATYTTEAVNRFEQKLTIAGMETDSEADARTVTKSTIGQRDAAGMLRVTDKIESMQISITAMGSNYVFDSANPDNKGNSSLEAVRDLHKALARQTTTTTYDNTNRVHKVELEQDVLGQLPDQVQQLAKSQLDPEYLKKQANQQLDQLPSEPVKKGDTWQRTESVNLGAGQVMTFGVDYTYEGTVEKDGKTLDKISSKVTSVSFALENSPLPLMVKGSQLKAEESEGTVLFDRTRGQIVESSSSSRVAGTIDFVINNMDLPSKLDLKIKVSATVK
jgi:hypothetical protein